ncbi:hypothetical protein DI272_25465 [Streptomyces sp. Act143]|uniref:hypothetical protein n=1 Tax=Streptomyces sp. Act143 TaxID=2200760 RepID=UPI000D6762CA|nr:hypothetical protein [Streptomyces sp. Act143]PWI17132.1 hypothetical protein DI272_25465 [Streptomyces sp. Act143]
MTSASVNFSRTATAAAMALAGVLALGACSSDGGSDSDDSTPSASASTGAAPSGSASSSAAASGELAGSWLATTKGKAVVLMVNGTEAGLFATGGTVCSGTAGEESGMQMIRLKCTDGSKDRATGMVDSVGRTTLKVTWEGGLGTETYTKAEGGKLPSGLPTASLG